MSQLFWTYYREAVQALGRMQAEHWAGLAVVVVVVGLFCMRGYGSRANY
jgi:hypothetical protein